MKFLDGLRAWAERREKFLFAAMLIVALARCLWEADRQMGFDELFTYYIARLGSIAEIVRAVPADGNPPLYYLLAHATLRLVDQPELAIRLPSVAAFAVTLLCVHRFVRRRCDAISALLATFALSTAFIRFFGSEARPYALVLAFTALALVCWQIAAERKSGRLPALAGMAAAIAGAVASHHYGVFHVGIPLAFGEATRLLQRKRLDWPVYVAGAVGAAMMAFTLPLVQQTNKVFLDVVRQSPTFAFKPSLVDLATYSHMVDRWFFVAFMLLLGIAWGVLPRTENLKDPPIPPHEVAAAIGVALLLPILLAVTWATTGYFKPRYVIGTSIGIAMLLGYATYASERHGRQGAVAALLTMALMTSIWTGARIVRGISGTVMPFDVMTGATTGSLLATLSYDRPLVVGSPSVWMRTWWYARPDLRKRLHYLLDPAYAARAGNPLGELSIHANRAIVPSPLDSFDTFTREHRSFLLYCQGMDVKCEDEDDDDWIKRRLQASGWTVRPLATRRDETIFAVDAPKR